MKGILYIMVGLLVACGGAAPQSASVEAPQSVPLPKMRTAKVVASYPHDPQAYTQGLLVVDGVMYESTGEYGRSSLRQVSFQTGKVVRQQSLDGRYFGEGLAADDQGNLYQLTWREGKVFVYEAPTFKKTATYHVTGEGWGLVWHGGELFLSDGSAVVKVLDPHTFAVKRTIAVRSDRGPVEWLNELEWVDGKLWANIYATPLIAVIDPASGVVEEWLDCSALERSITSPTRDVMNGIAYDSVAQRLFLTGKNWETLFEIER